MARVVIKFKDGEHININGDYIDVRDEFIFAWNGEFMVAIARASEVNTCYISEKNE